MKATGIIRRIDDLGRLVVPREVRRALSIKEGDPFEIFVEKDSITFKKYNPTAEYQNRICTLKQDILDDNEIPNQIEILKKIEELTALLKRDL